MILYPSILPVGGITLSPSLTLIKREYKDDKPLHTHERVHAVQMRLIGTPKFWVLYLFSSKFRQLVEVEAYRAQIQVGANRAHCAYALANNYLLGSTFQRAWDLLK